LPGHYCQFGHVRKLRIVIKIIHFPDDGGSHLDHMMESMPWPRRLFRRAKDMLRL